VAKYLIRHWVSADFIAEKVVDESEININTNDIGKHKTPDGTFSFVMINSSEKLNRTTYEIYDESINNSNKKRISD
tara:strand:+ start:1301 stop:1528 length:228 start_codon:yes stop_codon:yes gene_type:complete